MKKKREYIDFLIDIYQQTILVRKFIHKIKFEEFNTDIQLFYAICRALEIIGEAAKNLNKELINAYPDIEWSKMAKLRDIIIHHYSGLDEKVIWDICKIDLKNLHKKLLGVILTELENINDPVIRKLIKQKIKEINQSIKVGNK